MKGFKNEKFKKITNDFLSHSVCSMDNYVSFSINSQNIEPLQLIRDIIIVQTQ